MEHEIDSVLESVLFSMGTAHDSLYLGVLSGTYQNEYLAIA